MAAPRETETSARACFCAAWAASEPDAIFRRAVAIPAKITSSARSSASLALAPASSRSPPLVRGGTPVFTAAGSALTGREHLVTDSIHRHDCDHTRAATAR